MKGAVKKIIAGEPKHISRALSIIENKETGYAELIAELKAVRSEGHVIAVTGAAGAGKSTLINSCVDEYVKRGKKIAVIAVDPSSSISGGAILGDRIRMGSTREKVYIRSVATRGAAGGISEAAEGMVCVFRAAGFEYIIIETTGAGQSETAVAGISDVVVLVLHAGTGDDIQLMKVGLTEIGDIFVVNKADISGTEQFCGYIRSIYGDKKILLTTVATEGKGISGLVNKIDLCLNYEGDLKSGKKN
ncbi:MAG: ATP/GTP-binding protein [Oligoflexia bacterium]|nr:ATP/GTP-binding protein [Oligoflexia bacterium]